MVRLLANDHVWTGAVISDSGEILTTSAALESAPIATYTLDNGTQGEAWVMGRDDDSGLALLRPLVPSLPYEFIRLSPQAPTIGDELRLLQHSGFSTAIDQRPTSVSGYKPGILGFNYMQIRAADNSTADGAMLIDNQGRIQGIRMPSAWLLRHQIANPGEVYAVDAAQVGSTAIPSLRAGRYHTEPAPPGRDIGTIPPIPNLFSCNITVDGASAPVGAQVYARLMQPGQPDHWESDATTDLGYALVTVSAPSNSYHGAVVEFWANGKRASATGTYDANNQGTTVSLDLAF